MLSAGQGLRNGIRSLLPILIWLPIGCAAPPDPYPSVQASQGPSERPGSSGSMAVLFGAAYWPALGNLEADGSLLPPEDLGDFEDWGFSLDTVFEAPVTKVGNADLNIGMDFGVMSFDNKEKFDVLVLPFGDVYEERIIASLLYFTPSARLMFPTTPSSRAYVGLGLGYYLMSLEDSSFYSYNSSLTDDGAFGGFAAVGFDVFFGDGSVGLRIEDKLHYTEFGSIRGFSGDLDGFINTIEIGVVIAF